MLAYLKYFELAIYDNGIYLLAYEPISKNFFCYIGIAVLFKFKEITTPQSVPNPPLIGFWLLI